MRPLAREEEQVAFWRRHTRLGVSLGIVLPAVTTVHTWASPSPEHPLAIYVMSAAVACLSPLLLLVPVGRVVRHPYGRLFFDVWEAVGISLIIVFALLDGGATSPYVFFFYVVLAHAALAYPPAGVAIAGVCNVAGYLAVGAIGGDTDTPTLLAGALAMLVATGTCAFASHNHVRAYERTAAYARQIAVLAERDGLTGCLNHRAFHERLQAEAVSTDPEHPLSLLIVDLDCFKQVNDTYGHPAGDRVLQLLARTLHSLAKPGDVAGRLGGDEFALLLPGTAAADAAALAQDLCDEVRNALVHYAGTVSVGVATSTARADTAALLDAADRAVYRAKRAGRDRVADAAPGDRTGGRSTGRLEGAQRQPASAVSGWSGSATRPGTGA